jgi:hypothetical protein
MNNTGKKREKALENINVLNKAYHAGGSKKGPPKSVRRAEEAMGPELGARDEMDHNASVYLESIYNPWEVQGTRIPDLTFYPTGTQTDQFGISCGMVDGSTSGSLLGVKIRAHPRDQYKCVSAVVTPSSFTWGSDNDSPNYSDYNTRFSAIRCVSFGIKVLDYGKLLDRGVVCYMGVVPEDFEPTDVADITTATEMQLVDLSDKGIVKLNWLPIDGYVFEGTTPGVQPTSAEWYLPGALEGQFSGVDPVLMLAAWSYDATVSDVIQFQVTVNYETLPLVAYQRTVEREAVLGGQESTAVAWREIHKSDKSLAPATVTALSTGIHSHEGVVKKIRKLAYNGWKYAKGKALSFGKQVLTKLPYVGSLIGSLFGHDENLYKSYMFCLGGDLDISPYDAVIHELSRMDKRSRTQWLLAAQDDEKMYGRAYICPRTLPSICHVHRNGDNIPVYTSYREYLHSHESVRAPSSCSAKDYVIMGKR